MPGLTGMKGGGHLNPVEGDEELEAANGLTRLQLSLGWNKIPFGGTVLSVDWMGPSQLGIKSDLPNCVRIAAQFVATAWQVDLHANLTSAVPAI